MDWMKNSLQIFNALANPILVIDPDYCVVAANKAACSSFCLPGDDIVRQKCFTVTHGLERPCWQEGHNCPAKVAFQINEEAKAIHKHVRSEKVVFEEITAVPISDDQGNSNFVVAELRDISELIQAREISEHLKSRMQTLRGIIPICAACKKIRNDKGYWDQLEIYIRDHSAAEFSHGLCPECVKTLCPDDVDDE